MNHNKLKNLPRSLELDIVYKAAQMRYAAVREEFDKLIRNAKLDEYSEDVMPYVTQCWGYPLLVYVYCPHFAWVNGNKDILFYVVHYPKYKDSGLDFVEFWCSVTGAVDHIVDFPSMVNKYTKYYYLHLVGVKLNKLAPWFYLSSSSKFFKLRIICILPK
jgi:hypothetical protein